MSEDEPPVCFSCSCRFDPKTRERISDMATDGKRGSVLCMACQRRVDDENRAEEEVWSPRQ